MSYGGWTNYQTWVVNLCITNDQGTMNYWLEQAIDRRRRAAICSHTVWTPDEEARFGLADELKEYFEEDNPLTEGEPTVYTDLLQAALSEVNWNEIAQILIDMVKEGVTA